MRARRAIGLAETLISIVLVGGVLVVALNTVGSAVSGRQHISARAQAELLAHDLMAEILQQNYEEPDDQPLFGREGTESAATRIDYDDVDDYRNWNSTPLMKQDGTQIPGTANWGRSVTVDWVDPNDLTTVSATPTNVKRVSVDVIRSGGVVCQLVAVRTVGLPPPKTGPIVLFVVTSVNSPSAQETARQSLFDSWGFAVTLIADTDPQSAFDTGAQDAEVVYVSEEISPVNLGTKLTNIPIGVVSEEIELHDELGFSGDYIVAINYRDAVSVIDNSHYIVSSFAVGSLVVFASIQPVHMLENPLAPGLQLLTLTENAGSPGIDKPSLVCLETGAALYGGGTAPGRRVLLPWGDDGFDINALNGSGLDIMKRAVEWAAMRETP